VLFLTAMAVCVLAVSGFAFAAAFRHTDPMALRSPPARAVSTTGAVTDAWAHRNKGRVTGHTVFVSFRLNDAVHSVARYVAGNTVAHIPQELHIVVDPLHPSRARVDSVDVVSVGGLLSVCIPLLAALVLLSIGMRKAMKKLRLMENGVLTTARLVQSHTEQRSKGGPIHVLTFEYSHGVRAFERVVKTKNPARLLDEANEPVLFDEDDPDQAFLLDELALSPRRDNEGVMASTALWPVIVGVLVWAIALPATVMTFAWPFFAHAS
jgi:hypothetical protein